MKLRSKRAMLMLATVALMAAMLLMAAGTAAATTTYEKTPGGTSAEIADSVFYIAVATGTNGGGERLYYYFSLDELKTKYGIETRDFDYTNHTVGTTTSAHGFTIATLIDSLVDAYHEPLAIADTWSIQYLEEDAYHATGSGYIDTLAAARDTTKPTLTYEIKETFAVPTKYNVNDTEYVWAENLYPEYLRVYRQTDSANSSVMKMMMGITVSPDGKAFNDDTAGSYKLTGTDSAGNQLVVDSKGNAGRTVLGALAGMKIGVHAPTVAAYTPTASSQVITKVEPETTSTQTVTFSYTENEYFTAKDWTTGVTKTYTENAIAASTSTVQIPESLAFVQGLVSTGEAASIDANSIDPTTAEFTITIPSRKLFVDTRVTPNAFGYTDLNLYRYSGDQACDLAGVAAADVTNIVATDTDGVQWLFAGVDLGSCFVAYKDSHSKACPNNTSESKRFTWVYDHPKLVSESDGDVLVESLASVDVNAKLVKSLKVVTKAGKRRATIKRNRLVKLVAKTKPAKTVEILTWKSSKPKVASVNARGRVTAGKKRTGTVVITVTSSFGRKATFKVTVKK